MSCPEWCDDHIEDGYHQSKERKAGNHGLLLCQDDIDPPKSGIYFLEDFGGALGLLPMSRSEAVLKLVKLREAVIVKQAAVHELERAIAQVWA